MAIDTLRWNGSGWVTAPVKRWNGSSWVDARTVKWNGSSWIQMYPETHIYNTQYIVSTGVNNWRSGKWVGENAKQGEWGYGSNTGFLGLCANQIQGGYNVISVSGAALRGTRDGSGYYNNDQTIHLYRSNAYPGISPDGTITGWFSTTTGAPGSGGWMTDRWCNNLGEVLNWMNGANAKDQLFIYSTARSDYLGISGPQIGFDYVYQARMATFEAVDYMPLDLTPDMYMDIVGRRPYHTMLIYEEEKDMTLAEIIKRREEGIVEPIRQTMRIDVPEYHVYTKDTEFLPAYDNIELDIHVPARFRIEVLSLQWDETTEMSLDGVTWTHMQGIEKDQDNWVYGDLPSDFNQDTDNIYFRVRDKVKDVVTFERTISPCIKLI